MLATLHATGLIPADASVVRAESTLRVQPVDNDGVWLEPLPIRDPQSVVAHVDHGGYYASVHHADGMVFHMVQGHYGQPYVHPGPLDEFHVHDLGLEWSKYGRGTRLLVLPPRVPADFAAFQRTFRYFLIVNLRDARAFFGARPLPDDMFYDLLLDHRHVITGGVPYGRAHYGTLCEVCVSLAGYIVQETFDFLWRKYNPDAYVMARIVVFVARLRRRVWERRRYAPGGEGHLECVREWAEMM